MSTTTDLAGYGRQSQGPVSLESFWTWQRIGIISTIFLIAMIGLFAPAPKLSDEVQLEVDAIFHSAHEAYKGVLSAEVDLAEAKQSLAHAKSEAGWGGWLFGYAPRDAEAIDTWQRHVAGAQSVYDERKAHHEEILNSARTTAGIWSETGILEARDLYWDSFSNSFKLAMRIALDALIFSRSDRGLLDLLFTVLSAFVTGMALSWVLFGFKLAYLLYSYGAGVVSGTIVFVVFACCGVAWVFAIGSGAYAVVRIGVAASGLSLEAGPSRRQRMKLH